MPIRITCPSCKASYPIDDSFRGKRFACRECQKLMAIPAAKPATAAPLAEKALPKIEKTSPDAGIIDPKTKPIIAAKPPVGGEIPAEAKIRSQPNPDKNAPSSIQIASPQKSPANPAKKKSNGPLLLLICGGVALFGFVMLAVASTVGYFWLVAGTNKSAKPATQVVQDIPKAKVSEPLADVPKAQASDSPKKQAASELKVIPEKPKPKNKPKPPPVDVKPAPLPINGQLNREVLVKVKQATVYLRVTLPNGLIAQGSGFFGIEPGLVLTNAHVLGMLNPNSAPPKQVHVVYQSGEPDSRTFSATILGVDRTSDLALLRVGGDNLPEPLDVKPTTDLIETQTVYVVGFPFGDSLGKNITVSQSSVSSLRKAPTGEVMKVQVNGGMHPGNSGGPVVNTVGEVVGVAVSGIEATQINFAVPGEFVHAVLNGRLTGISNGNTVRDGEEIQMPLLVQVLDPLNRVQKVALHWWIANPGKGRPPADVPPTPEPGDSPHNEVAVTYKNGRGQATIVLPGQLLRGQIVWVQPMIVNAIGQAKWLEAASFIPPAPIEKQPALLALKHYWGARPVKFTTSSQLRLSAPGLQEQEFSVNVNATMTESMVGQQKNDAALRMRYVKYEIGMPTQLVTSQGSALMKRLVPKLGGLHADLVVDDRNNLKKNTLDLSRLPQDVREDITDLHSQIQESLDALSVLLPGRKMNPGDSWKGKKSLMVFTGDRGKPAPMEVTYTYEGIRSQDERSQAQISMVSSASDQFDQKLGATGSMTGTAYLDLTAFQIARAEVIAELSISDGGGKRMIVSLKSKMERALGKEVFKKSSQLTAKSPRDAKGCPFELHLVKLDADKPCVVSLESSGKGYFDTSLRIEDPTSKQVAEDDNSGVDSNSLIVFTPNASGSYRIVATCPQPSLGSYFLVVRQ